MSESFQAVNIGTAALMWGDCREIVPKLSGTAIDAVVTDPPYGMKWNTDSTRFSGGQRRRGDGRDDYGSIEGDAADFDPSPWLSYPKVVLWGANHYANKLPRGTSLVWLKKPDHLFGTFLSDAEIGWMKGGHGVYVHRKYFSPTTRAQEAFGAIAHPTQKPVSLMAWSLQRAKVTGTVLDPYMGSGTTGLACASLGVPFIGIEIAKHHFDKAVERLTVWHSQGELFSRTHEGT